MMRDPLPDWILCSDWGRSKVKFDSGGKIEQRGTHHPLTWDEEVTNGSSEVIHAPPSERVALLVLCGPHYATHALQEEEVVVHRRERDRVQDAQTLDKFVRPQERQHRREVGRVDLDRRRVLLGGCSPDSDVRVVRVTSQHGLGGMLRRDAREESPVEVLVLVRSGGRGGFDDVEEVEEGVRRVAVVAGERLEGELAVEEDDGVLPGSEEVLGGGGPARAGGEVVEEANAERWETLDEGYGELEEGTAYTLCSRGTVVPPLCKWRRRGVSMHHAQTAWFSAHSSSISIPVHSTTRSTRSSGSPALSLVR